MEDFKIKTAVHFGTDALRCLEKLKGNRIFIVTDPFMVESKMVESVTIHLKNAQYEIFSKVVPDPPLELVVEGIQAITAFSPDTLVALGGGSAIDEAKAIMHFAKNIGNIPQMEFIAVPTTSGTGSEVTSFAVITDKGKGVKYPLVDQELLPDRAVLDPELVKSLPAVIVADTGMDVLTHALEAYVSTKANAFTDAFAEKAALMVFQYLVKSYENAGNLEAREQMHYASCMAGIAFDKTSLGVNHAIAHNIGGKFGVPHGRTNAILLPHVVEFNAQLEDYNQKEFNTAARKYARLAQLAGFGGGNVRSGVKNLIHQIQKMQKQMKMPQSFREYGLKQDQYKKAGEDIARGALADGCIRTNPRPAGREDVLYILKQAFERR